MADKDVNADFLGGPAEVFDEVGREQLAVLLDFGLLYSSRVLNVGCGCLRGGRWIIPLLSPGHYFGIEPATAMLKRGLRDFLEPEMLALKRPIFDHNDRFDFGVFGADAKFSHVIARSVWTHADKHQITQMLRSFKALSAPNGVFVASFVPASWHGRDDYRGTGWVGRSHESSVAGMVRHSYAWIASTCASLGILAKRVAHRPPVNGQSWIVMTHAKR